MSKIFLYSNEKGQKIGTNHSKNNYTVARKLKMKNCIFAFSKFEVGGQVIVNLMQQGGMYTGALHLHFSCFRTWIWMTRVYEVCFLTILRGSGVGTDNNVGKDTWAFHLFMLFNLRIVQKNLKIYYINFESTLFCSFRTLKTQELRQIGGSGYFL